MALSKAARASHSVAKAAIRQAFTEPPPSLVERNLRYLAEQTSAVALDLQRLFARPLHDRMDVVDALYDMHQYFNAEQHQEAQVSPLFRGSMLHMGRFLLDCVTAIRDDATAVEYATAAFELLGCFVLAGNDNILSLADASAAAAGTAVPQH